MINYTSNFEQKNEEIQLINLIGVTTETDNAERSENRKIPPKNNNGQFFKTKPELERIYID